MKKEIQGLHKEIVERDDTIQDKVRLVPCFFLTILFGGKFEKRSFVNLKKRSFKNGWNVLIYWDFEIFRKREFMTWKRRIKNWRNSSLCWITRSRSWRNRLSPERMISNRWRTKSKRYGTFYTATYHLVFLYSFSSHVLGLCLLQGRLCECVFYVWHSVTVVVVCYRWRASWRGSTNRTLSWSSASRSSHRNWRPQIRRCI